MPFASSVSHESAFDQMDGCIPEAVSARNGGVLKRVSMSASEHGRMLAAAGKAPALKQRHALAAGLAVECETALEARVVERGNSGVGKSVLLGLLQLPIGDGVCLPNGVGGAGCLN